MEQFFIIYVVTSDGRCNGACRSVNFDEFVSQVSSTRLVSIGRLISIVNHVNSTRPSSFSELCAAFAIGSRAMIAKRGQIIALLTVLIPLPFAPVPPHLHPLVSPLVPAPILQISTFQLLDVLLRAALKIPRLKTGLCLSLHVFRNHVVLTRVSCVNGMSKLVLVRFTNRGEGRCQVRYVVEITRAHAKLVGSRGRCKLHSWIGRTLRRQITSDLSDCCSCTAREPGGDSEIFSNLLSGVIGSLIAT